MSGQILELRDKVRELLHEEIRRLVADALERDDLVLIGPAAERLAAAYSARGFSADHIADELVRAGISAGITMEMSRPRAGRPQR